MNKIKKLLLICCTCILGLSLFSCAQPTQEVTKYTVSFDVNGHGETVKSIEVDANTVLAKDQLAPLTSGKDYSFIGWFDGDTKAVGGEYKVTKNVTLKAHWDAVIYTISYINCEDVSNNPNPLQYTVESETIVLKEVSKPNYKFNGWFTNSSFLEGKITQIDKGSTGNITLYASFVEAIPPKNVSNVNASYKSNTISLSWTKPSDIDFKGVNVYVDGVKKNTVEGKTSVDITNLTNGKVYNVTLKAFDNNNNESDGVTKTYSLYALTENPKVVETKVINGKSFDIMIFGDYPQTLMKEEITLSEEITTVNGMECKFGNDGRYYAKFTAELLGPQNAIMDDRNFNNGTPIVHENDYYFAIEPIRWRVLKNNEDGSKLLLSEIGIETDRKFRTQEYYNVSELRNYIIGEGDYKDKGIINKAFTPTALEQIKETTITETPYKTTDGGVATYTINDKLFLLDREDFLNEEYGFTSVVEPEKGNTISERQIPASDYALAFAPVNDFGYPSYFCRRNNSELLEYRDVISGDGALTWDGNYVNHGILPALTLK